MYEDRETADDRSSSVQTLTELTTEMASWTDRLFLGCTKEFSVMNRAYKERLNRKYYSLHNYQKGRAVSALFDVMLGTKLFSPTGNYISIEVVQKWNGKNMEK